MKVDDSVGGWRHNNAKRDFAIQDKSQALWESFGRSDLGRGMLILTRAC